MTALWYHCRRNRIISERTENILKKKDCHTYRKRVVQQSLISVVIASTIKLVADVGEKSNDSRALDRVSELSLMLSASAGDSSGKNLCTFGDILSQSDGILVVNRFDLFCAELADLSSLAAILSAVGLCCGFSLFLDLSGLDFLCVIQCFSFLSLIK